MLFYTYVLFLNYVESKATGGGGGGGGGGQGPGSAQYQHLSNCIPDIPITSPAPAPAHLAPRPSVPTLSYGRALYCIRASGMTRTYVVKEPYGGLGLIVGLRSRSSCCELSQSFSRIASTLKPFIASLLSSVTKNQDDCMDVAADCAPIAEAVNLTVLQT